mmetsp:Transcript_43873/g.114397  ORF Transcript_43873/g.114397 Transcript_43873/m.114397 type:complete len:1004 (-) Transcript_43873:2389-5400(-)
MYVDNGAGQTVARWNAGQVNVQYSVTTAIFGVTCRFSYELLSFSVLLFHSNSSNVGSLIQLTALSSLQSNTTQEGEMHIIVESVSIRGGSAQVLNVRSAAIDLPFTIFTTVLSIYSQDNALRVIDADCEGSLRASLFGRVESAVVSGGSAQLFQSSGASGVFNLSSVHLFDVSVSPSLLDVQQYNDDFASKMVVHLSNVTCNGCSVLSENSDGVVRVGGSVMLVLSPSCLFLFNTYTSTFPVITLDKGVTAPTIDSTVGGENECVRGGEKGSECTSDSAWFHLEVAASSSLSDGGDGASLYLLSISDGGFVGNHSMLLPQFSDEVVQTTNVDAVGNYSRLTEHLSCPFGYAYTYTITFRQEYDTRLENGPYFCSNPISSTASSCDALAYSAEAYCTPCSSGTISFLRGSADANRVMVPRQDHATQHDDVHCRACPSTFLCAGPASIQAQAGYWFPSLPRLWQYTNGAFDEKEVIVKCLSGACQPDSPLKYTDGSLDLSTSLCTSGRDMSSPLCSVCMKEYSADLLSDKCIHQSPSSAWPVTSVLFFVFAFMLVLAYLVFLHLKPLTPQSPWLRIVLNFYSVIGILYTSAGGGGSFVIDGALQILSIFTSTSSNTSNSDSSFYIVIPGAQPIDVYLAKGVLSASVGLIFVLSMILRYLFARAQHRDNIRKRLVFGLFSVLLISYSSLSDIVFSFLPCTNVTVLHPLNSTLPYSTGGFIQQYESESRLLIHAEWDCWRIHPFSVFLLVLGIAFVFGFPFGLLIWQGLFPSGDRWVHQLVQRFSTLKCLQGRRTKEKDRSSSSIRASSSSQTTSRGKGTSWSGVSLLFLLEGHLRVWYWDALLFYRRALFQLVFVVMPIGVIQQSLFVVLTAVVLVLHVHFRPYDSLAANYTETVSYLLLLFVNMLNFPAIAFSSVTLQETSDSRAFLQSLSRAQSVLAFVGLLLLAVVMGGVYSLKLCSSVRSCRRRSSKGDASRRRRKDIHMATSLELDMELTECSPEREIRGP